MVAAVSRFISMFKDFGVSTAVVQRAQVSHDQVSTLFWINVALSTAVSLLTVTLAPAVVWFYASPSSSESPSCREQFEQRIVVAGHTISILKSVPPRRRDAMLSSLYAQLGRPEPHSLKPFRMMDWTDVTAMEATSLISFGAHTVHHEILSQLPDEDLRNEIVASIAEVRAKTSTHTRTFAYPNGSPADYDERAKRLLEASGVSAAVSTIGGLNSPRTDPFALRRVTVGRDMTFAQFRLATSGVTHGLGRAVARIPGVRARHTT